MRAILNVAESYGSASSCKRKDIAESENISDSYLENILIILKTGGLIKTIRGAKGGYQLSRAPWEISLLEIVHSLEGPLDLVDCVGSPISCERQPDCVTHLLWKDLSESWQMILKKRTLQDLLDLKNQGKRIDFVI
ncbi:Iron-sulfur cluster regulator IscR [Chitinispirillum alkaliphilum]|nr:Iron-sulfur cluster regulator IscR [Chitinispirillum alkaliphilum]